MRWQKVTWALAALVLASCGTAREIPVPEPKVIIREVKVPVPTPCIPAGADLRSPEVPDTDAALLAAASGADRLLLLAAGRLVRDAWIAGMGPVLRACVAPADDVPR